jgi:hypothetical protein
MPPLPVLIAIAVPFLILAFLSYLRWLYGDEHFNLDWPGHDLNRADDNRLVKLRLDPEPTDKP